MKKNIKFTSIALVVPAIVLLNTLLPSFASKVEPQTKTMTVELGEGELEEIKLSKTVNIPNLKEVVNVSIDTGEVNYTVDGEDIKFVADKGSPSRVVINPKKESKEVAESRRNNNNYFSPTINYNSNGYSGSLSKSGASYSYSGDWKNTDDMRKEKESGEILSLKYDYGGYREIYFVQARFDTDYEGDFTGHCELSLIQEDGSRNGKSVIIDTQNHWSLQGRYSGNGRDNMRDFESYMNLPRQGETYIFEHEGKKYKVEYTGKFAHYRGASNGMAWGADLFVGDVEYVQRYAGTVYKPGNDNYYKYNVTIEYIDNSNPDLNVVFDDTKYYSNKRPSILKGTVVDADLDDKVSIYYSINEEEKQVLLKDIKTKGIEKDFDLNLNTDKLKDGEYILKIWAEDDKGNLSQVITKALKLDRTPPTMKIRVK